MQNFIHILTRAKKNVVASVIHPTVTIISPFPPVQITAWPSSLMGPLSAGVGIMMGNAMCHQVIIIVLLLLVPGIA